jgi:hypothetical protein
VGSLFIPCLGLSVSVVVYGEVVLVQNAVSITCSVLEDGKTRWWWTRESGKVPPVCGQEGCSRCRRSDSGVKRVEPRAYPGCSSTK